MMSRDLGVLEMAASADRMDLVSTLKLVRHYSFEPTFEMVERMIDDVQCQVQHTQNEEYRHGVDVVAVIRLSFA